MGTDYFASWVWTSRRLVDLDWKAGKRWIKEASDEMLGDEAENADDPDAFREILADDLADLEGWLSPVLGESGSVYIDPPRDSTWAILGDILMLMTGGMTGGDDPTETFTVLNRLGGASGLLEAVGFFDRESKSIEDFAAVSVHEITLKEET